MAPAGARVGGDGGVGERPTSRPNSHRIERAHARAAALCIWSSSAVLCPGISLFCDASLGLYALKTALKSPSQPGVHSLDPTRLTANVPSPVQINP